MRYKMKSMTQRERFNAVTNFRQPDRLPLYEWVGIDDETIMRWIREGLPIEKVVGQSELFVRGELLSISCYRLFSYFQPVDYLGLDRTVELDIDLGPIPRFGYRVLEEDERHRIVLDEGGIKKKIMKDRPFIMPQMLEYPVKNRMDWERAKKHFNPVDPRRYPLDWSEEKIEYYRTVEYPVRLRVPGFFGFGRQLMGMTSWLLAFHKYPELVSEMEEFWSGFLIETIRPAVEALKSNVDCATIWEDMAYKNGPLVSPTFFRKFMLPGYRKLTEFLKRNGIHTILVDTDGDSSLLIPPLLEGGVNGIYPLEVQAGMDAVALRKQYGKRLILIGNIDKLAIAKGKEAIEKEVESKVPYLKEQGGYIPSSDHIVPPDVGYQDYQYYLSFIRKFL
jgi:uroporphyrinogen decarboxylase